MIRNERTLALFVPVLQFPFLLFFKFEFEFSSNFCRLAGEAMAVQ